MTRAARLLAAALPIAGLAGLWALNVQTYNQGTEWEVPIRGYDPRDILRGHYVEFGYDWPGVESTGFGGPDALCLEGTAPRIARVTVRAAGAPCAHPIAAPVGGVYGTGGLARGRLYLGQERAAAMQSQLQNRDRRGLVTIRQRADGSFTPIAIRFRPLTPAERAARDAPPTPAVVPSAPPIMAEPEK